MTDWPTLRREYVNGSLQLKELAEKHGLKPATVRARSHREDWEAERNAVQRAVTHVAQARLTEDRATALARFNDDDLKVARAIRGKAASMLATAKSPADLPDSSEATDDGRPVSDAVPVDEPASATRDASTVHRSLRRRAREMGII